jgi:hypothetical protein
MEMRYRIADRNAEDIYAIKQPVSQVFLNDNKLSAFYGKQPSDDRELEESDMVDTTYDKNKKARGKWDKIKEIKRFLYELSNSTISLPSLLTLARCQ